MDNSNITNSTLQSLSPDKREDLEHELRPEALASIAREENNEASTNTTHAAVSPKTTRAAASETETRAVTIFSHPTRIAEAVDELWGGALRYEEEL